MAGTLQTLILTPPTTKTPSLRHRSRHFPSNRALFHIPSITFNRDRSFRRPITALDRSRDGNGDKVDRVSGSASGLSWAKPLLNFASKNFLPLALVGGVTYNCVIKRKRRDHPQYLLVSILMITPYFSRAILQMQLHPQEFVTGLAMFSRMPTTLSSGVALTHLAGGNSALALAMTVISNMLGILIIPFSISKFIADGVGVSVPTEQLFRSLVLTLLVPLILGKVLRESFKGLGDFVDQNRKLFSKLSALFLSLRSLLLRVKPAVFLVAIGMGVLLHIILLAFNALAIKSFSAVSGGDKSIFSKRENASALVLVATQKTLPVMVAVVEQLGGAFGESGLLVLPWRIRLIIMDSFLVNFWLPKDLSSSNAKVN
ncbi:hypothetical protein RGQ29_017462 [Quercus rubra]|uniref:Sodium/metabolite cotransporter BASS4, chloroplastic n=1 Tax=Quercus rubra TaxID=3512 RepID=A0AAN7J0I2_QUERU|nr:hypothetical protein RGQ29_017462 [Quercus rubra]